MAQRAQGTRRVWVPAAFLGAFALVVFGRLVQLQIIDHPKYALAAEQEQTGHETIYARRGSILDRNGNVLAASVDTWDVSINSRVWADEATATSAATALAGELNVTAASLHTQVAAGVANGQVRVLIQKDVEYETGKRIVADAIPGVVVDPDTKRVNPEGDVGASIIGLIGGENVGLAGIESSYNEMLQGKPGEDDLRARHGGRRDPVRQVHRAEPGAGFGPGADDRPLRAAAGGEGAGQGDYGPRGDGRFDHGDGPATGEILALRAARVHIQHAGPERPEDNIAAEQLGGAGHV